MKQINRTKRFKKDYKREKRTDPNVEALLREAINLLAEGRPLPEKMQDHGLGGDWRDHRDCHIKPDLILIYSVSGEAVNLVRLGSHSELF